VWQPKTKKMRTYKLTSNKKAAPRNPAKGDACAMNLPPLEYLLSCSETSLGDLELAALDRSAGSYGHLFCFAV
jgi:hypothetical protein